MCSQEGLLVYASHKLSTVSYRVALFYVSPPVIILC